MTIPQDLFKLLEAVGITFVRIAPRRDYWELVYKAPFVLPIRPWKNDAYVDKPERFTVRHTFRDVPQSGILLQLAQDIGEYIDALKQAQEMIIRVAINDVRDDDQKPEKTE